MSRKRTVAAGLVCFAFTVCMQAGQQTSQLQRNQKGISQHVAQESSSQHAVEIASQGMRHVYPSSLDEKVTLNFEEVDLQLLADHIEQMHHVRFIFPDTVQTDKAKKLADHKVTFRTAKDITKKESWDLFIRFLSLAGFDLVPAAKTGWYSIVPFTKAPTEALPTYIGVDPEVLPDNDMVVRYVYFFQNVQPTNIQGLLNQFKSSQAKIDVYSELQALIFTDKAHNIKYLMRIARELDRSVRPQMMSVIKMQHVDANDVKGLYQTLLKGGNLQSSGAGANAKKTASLQYFSPELTVIAEPRTNALILLGPEKAITRFEDFITKHIDVQQHEEKEVPLYSYTLEYTNAQNIKAALDSVLKYNSAKNADAAKYGGVRDGYKFLKPVKIIVDEYSNTLLFHSTKEDFDILQNIIKQLDVPPKQVAIEALFVEVHSGNNKELGMQVGGTEGKTGTFFDNLSTQTTHLGGLAATSQSAPADAWSIKKGLASLLGSVGANAGSTVLTFGQPIWGVFKILNSISSTKVIAAPFGVTSNNTKLYLTAGETRRLISAEVVSSGSTKSTGFEDAEANLKLDVTPRINSTGMVDLQVTITNNKFAAGSTNDRTGKEITTHAVLANGEVLVLGGVMKENISSTHTGTPFLEKIPLFGWLFKKKKRNDTKDHFVVFISPRVLEPGYDQKSIDAYTQSKIEQSQKYLTLMETLDTASENRDPLYRSFFGTDSPYRSQPLEKYKTRHEREKEKELQQNLLRDEKRTMRKLKRSKKRKKKPHSYKNMINELYAQEKTKKTTSKRAYPLSRVLNKEAA